MDMRSYLKKYKRDQPRLQRLADEVGVSRIYLTQIGAGHGRPSGPLARRLHQASGGELSLEDLRPDIFGAVDGVDAPLTASSD